MESTSKPSEWVFGGALIIFLIYATCVGVVDLFNRLKPVPPVPPPSAYAVDTLKPTRFQLVQLGNFRRDQFLMDTATGRIWQNMCIGKLSKNGVDCSENGWAEMTVFPPAYKASDSLK